MSQSVWTRLPEHHRIALLTDGCSSPDYAKTAISLLRYREPDIVAVIDRQQVGKTAQDLFRTGAPCRWCQSGGIRARDAVYLGTPQRAARYRHLALLIDAIRRGIDVVSGLHEFLVDDPAYVRLAEQSGSQLVDVRRNRFKSTAQCRRFPEHCIRIHSVGHDCSVGKMVTTLEVERELKARGERAKFLATGQTGIMITGEGAPIDCVVSDFVNGAVEQLVAQNEQHDFLMIEGQGSIAHPAFSAVTAGLLHGCAPQGLIFCWEAGRTEIKGLNQAPIAPLDQQMAAVLAWPTFAAPAAC